MRFIIMHKTSPHWETGAPPTRELVARVGAMLGELHRDGTFLAGEGLRATSQGARVRFSGGRRTIVRGPFTGEKELPSGFTIVRAASLDGAIEFATEQAKVLGDCEMDIRPVTEPWDIGMGTRPEDVTTVRYMILRKASTDSEADNASWQRQRETLARTKDQPRDGAVHLVTENMRPSARGRRYINTQDGVRFSDGPFTESKEMLGGYVVIAASSLDQADALVRRYIDAVGPEEVDIRELQ